MEISIAGHVYQALLWAASFFLAPRLQLLLQAPHRHLSIAFINMVNITSRGNILVTLTLLVLTVAVLEVLVFVVLFTGLGKPKFMIGRLHPPVSDLQTFIDRKNISAGPPKFLLLLNIIGHSARKFL